MAQVQTPKEVIWFKYETVFYGAGSATTVFYSADI